MELYFLRHAEWESLYNCTGLNQSVAVEKSPFQVQAWAYIVLCAVYYLLYVPCIVAIWKHHWNHPCYTLLLYIGAVDLSVLWMLGFLHGWMTLRGTVFCTNPVFMYFTGLFATTCWIAEGTADLILALNRCLEIVWPEMAKKLFAGKRTHIWLLLCSIYAIYWFMFVKPAIFSALYAAYFFNPFVGFRDDNELSDPTIHVFHNIVVAIGSPTIYFIFFMVLFIKWRNLKAFQNVGQNSSMARVEKMTFLQVLIISSMNTTCGTIYMAMQQIIPAQWLITVAQFTWFHIHAFPPVIYLALNKTIRSECFKLIKKISFKKFRNIVNPTSNGG